MKIALIIISVFCLTSCADIVQGMHNPMPDTTAALKTETKENTKPYRAKLANFFYPEGQDVIVPPTVTTQPYCYKTWDKPVCYTQPEPGQDARLVGRTGY